MTTIVTGSAPSHMDPHGDGAISAATRTRVSSPGLASLQPLRVEPAEFSPRTRMVLALRRIEFLRVVQESAKDAASYQLHVFFKSPEHHIPLSEYSNGSTLTTRPQWMVQDPAAATRTPDVVVDRSLTELCKLHEELFLVARNGHKLEPCGFCLGVIEYCGYSRAKPQRSMTWLHSSESVCERLSLYLNELLPVVSKVKAFHPDGCAGQETVPVVLHRFLLPSARGGSSRRRASVASPPPP